jgi:hypothetical protein
MNKARPVVIEDPEGKAPPLRVDFTAEGDMVLERAGGGLVLPKHAFPAFALVLEAIIEPDGETEENEIGREVEVLPSGTRITSTDDWATFEFPNDLGILGVDKKDEEGDVQITLNEGPPAFMPAVDVERVISVLRKAAE